VIERCRKPRNLLGGNDDLTREGFVGWPVGVSRGVEEGRMGQVANELNSPTPGVVNHDGEKSENLKSTMRERRDASWRVGW